jgi:hypothetical protein
MIPITAKECSIAIHLVLLLRGENSLIHTGAYITQKAYVKPSINRIETKSHQLLDTEKIKQAIALEIILKPKTLFAFTF